MVWKYRGYDAVGKKGWVYGDLTHAKRILQEYPYVADRLEVSHYEVHPESVGICTFVKDDDGTELYEGDICRVAAYGQIFNMQIIYDKQYGRFMYANGGRAFGMDFAVTSRKIGNVFENKKLLDEKD